MPRFAFDYAFHINFSAPVRLHNYLLRCVPRMEFFQTIQDLRCTVQGEKVKLWPYTNTKHDSFGNIILSGMDAQDHTSFSIHVSGVVDHKPYRICDHAHGMYGVASAFTLCTPEMLALLRDILEHHETMMAKNNAEREAYGVHALRLCDSQVPDTVNAMANHGGKASHGQFQLACAIAHAVHTRLHYVPQSTHVETLAGEAFALNSGVCQDYAHITIALCRMAGIPARYACGFITGEGESHAWVEVYIHGVWYGIDPTQNRLIYHGYIKVAHGRDSADCPMNRGTFCPVPISNVPEINDNTAGSPSGPCTQDTSISVKVTSL